jgi:protocatechuate 3,4-dioxygenase beta subunit
MERNPDKKLPRVRYLSRGEVLGLMGSSAAAVALAGCGSSEQSGQSGSSESASTPTCVAKPQQTEGPYFVDERLDCSDIRLDPTDGSIKEGVPLALAFNVSQIDSNSSCSPLAGAVVDVWHCDALGQYSDVENNVGRKFLRGYQVTDENGSAQFQTIYPGWYQGRAVHIHYKIRTDPDSEMGYEFTSQLYFDDALTQEPYAEKGERDLRNSDDGIFREGGEELTLALSEDGQGGYGATFDIALEPTYTQN